jgi:hypothetical protein
MKEYKPEIQLYAFADELKLYCKAHHDELVGLWQLANQTKELPACKNDPIYGYTPILQWYGTNVARESNPNVWVEKLNAKIEKEKPHIAVVTDVRFQNEADYIKNAGGFLVDVIRKNADGSQYQDPGRSSTHPSEVALDDYEGWDFIIMCRDGDLKGLRAKAIGVINILTNKYGSYDELISMASEVCAMPDATGEPYLDMGGYFEFDNENS